MRMNGQRKMNTAAKLRCKINELMSRECLGVVYARLYNYQGA